MATYFCRFPDRHILLMGCGKHDSNIRFTSQEEVAIRRSLLQHRHRVKRSRFGDVAIGRRRRSRDQEIAPTAPPSGEEVAIRRCRHREKKEKSRSGDRSYKGGVRREGAIGRKSPFMERSRSGDRSYKGGVRREGAIGRSLLQQGVHSISNLHRQYG